MKVFALVGKSGTGKSHHSMWVAKEYGLQYIIDDGLLIGDNRIIAGKSAKREPNKVASVRCAVFNDPAHAKEVRIALREEQVSSLLIIGTSDKMVQRIAETLKVGPIERIIRIEEVSSEEEIQLAHDIREKQGKHVIPVPTFEVKRQFSGYFMDPLMLLFKKKDQTIMEEKTVMRPSYSYLGEFKISPKAISDICIYEATRFPMVHKVLKVRSSTTPGGRLMLDMDVSMHYPCAVNKEAEKVAQKVKTAIEEFTAVTVRWVHVNIKDLHMKS